jgi:hypothetical protein
MRINCYSEEITHRIEVVEKTADTGKPFWGLRVHLKSPPDLHHTAEIDDTSAVTFWFESVADLNDFRQRLYTAAQNQRQHP